MYTFSLVEPFLLLYLGVLPEKTSSVQIAMKIQMERNWE